MQYWAQKALDVLRAKIVLAQNVTRDTDFSEPGWKGKSITIPYPGTLAPVDKVEGTPVTPQVPVGGSSVTLTLNKHKVQPILVEDFARAQANQDLMNRYVEPAMVGLAEQLETDLFVSLLGVSPTTALVGTAGTSMTAATIRSANVNLNKNKVPSSDRFLAISPADEMALLGDTNLSTFWAFSQADSIRNGYSGRLYGYDTYMSQLAPQGYNVSLGAPTAGTFTLTVGGQTTAGIAYNATAATVQTAVQGLTSVGAGNAIVTGATGGPFIVTLVNGIAGPVTGSGTGLTGGTFAIAATQLNFAFHKDAVMLACRPFVEPAQGSGVQTAQAMDPESGLSIRVSTQYDINNMGHRVNFDILYGSVTLRSTNGQIIQA